VSENLDALATTRRPKRNPLLIAELRSLGLMVQPSDLGSRERQLLQDIASAEVRIIEPAIVSRLERFGLVTLQSGTWRLTRRGHHFRELYRNR
jgi:hypothetical protein